MIGNIISMFKVASHCTRRTLQIHFTGTFFSGIIRAKNSITNKLISYEGKVIYIQIYLFIYMSTRHPKSQLQSHL
jgi:hypothetical protein